MGGRRFVITSGGLGHCLNCTLTRVVKSKTRFFVVVEIFLQKKEIESIWVKLEINMQFGCVFNWVVIYNFLGEISISKMVGLKKLLFLQL